MSQYERGNSIGVATRFQPGQSGNPAGAKRGCASIREHWNALLGENADGEPKYTLTDLWHITEAPNDDPKISTARRIAAKQIIEAVEGGRHGLDVIQAIFDRTEGKAPMRLSLSGGPEQKRIILMDQATPGNVFGDMKLIEDASESA